MEDHQPVRKLRVLCLHAFRTSGKIFEQQTEVWPEFVREKMDFVFIDGPFPAEGESGVQGEFDPPYYEWFHFNKDFSGYRNFDECIAYIEDCMTRMGPFDGLLGFSQGAIISSALPGMQAKGVALTSLPMIKFVMLIAASKFGGSMFPSPKLSENAFSSPIQCPSLHFLGEKDRAKPNGIELLDSFVDPLVMHHPEGHVVPQLDEKGSEIMLKFIEKVQKLLLKGDKRDSVSTVRDVLGRWGKKVGEATKKAEDLAGNTWQHLKTAPSFADAAMGRIAQGTKVLAEGGYEKIFRQTFETVPEEQLLNSYACYLSTSAGPVMGVLYVSTAKLAFSSDNPLSYKAGDKEEWSYYKVIIPLHQLKAVNPSTSRANFAEKYIQVISVDNHEFWFMSFLNYDSAVKCLRDALDARNLFV